MRDLHGKSVYLRRLRSMRSVSRRIFSRGSCDPQRSPSPRSQSGSETRRVLGIREPPKSRDYLRRHFRPPGSIPVEPQIEPHVEPQTEPQADQQGQLDVVSTPCPSSVFAISVEVCDLAVLRDSTKLHDFSTPGDDKLGEGSHPCAGGMKAQAQPRPVPTAPTDE